MSLEYKNVSLAKQIRKVITYRITIGLLLLFVAVIVFSTYTIFTNFSLLKSNISQESEELKNFIISQILIDNELAIELKLREVNAVNPAIQFFWIKTNNNFSINKMQWEPLWGWHYYIPITLPNNPSMGYLEVHGSFWFDRGLFSQFLMQLSLLLIFLVGMFLLLFPLATKIPHNLIIHPINDLLNLIKSKGVLANIPNNNYPLEIIEIREKIITLLKETQRQSQEIAFTQISAQVAHDIRSPLAALNNMTANELAAIPEEQRNTIRNTINRINDIANNLLTKYRSADAVAETTSVNLEHIASLLESIVSEKRAQYANKDISINLDIANDTRAAFAKVNATEFKRALSNLINNSVEAITENGKIQVTLSSHFSSIKIEIIDNGCGIPADILPKVLAGGISIGKQSGTGLGLSYTLKCIEAWNGEYAIQSRVNEGTRFEIILPLVEPATWFFSRLSIFENTTILILDDDELIHGIWKKRFKEALVGFNDIAVKHFRDPQALLSYCETHGIENTQFLIDYELIGHNVTGLDIIKQLNIARQSALVTSRYDDPEVRAVCEKLAVKIIPKGFAVYIPIEIIYLNPDLIFIDDSELLTDSWKNLGELAGKKIAVFTQIKMFMAARHYYPHTTPIYIDSELNSYMKGEEFAKELFAEGFKTIYLATGRDKNFFPPMPWIKAIVSKDPPFEV